MPSSYTLGSHYEAFIKRQLASGRYNNASEVVRDALRLMEERERRLKSLDQMIYRGIAQADAGDVYDAEEFLRELEAKQAARARTRRRKHA
jgi:antitoxin ParD1/3/4